MAISRFEDNILNLYFLDYTKDDKSDKGCKVRSLINHFKQILSNSVSIDDSQSIDEYMVKFKGRNNMSKTIQSNGVSSFGIDVLVKQNTCPWAKKKAQKKTWDQVLL